MNRQEKLEWLQETCSEEFLTQQLLIEIVMWMGEDDFSKFYEHLCGCWDIAGSPEELDTLMSA